MKGRDEAKNRFARHAESEAKKDSIPMSERKGSIIVVAGIVLVILFFLAHQIVSTGLFNSKFGPAEVLLFYAPLVLAAITFAARIAVGRKNVVRPFDALLMALVAIATVWLFIVFPFDFSHLADVLPSFLRFLLNWISDDVAKVVMSLQILGSSFAAVYTAALYMYVRRELSMSKKSGA